ncbi:MAG: hypothetical protein AAGB31_12260, partial [Bdellovibrio sp.]
MKMFYKSEKVSPTKRLIIFFVAFQISILAYANGEKCEIVFSTDRDLIAAPEARKDRKKLAQALVDSSNDLNAYNVKWQTKADKYAGPLHTEGEFLVVGYNNNSPAFKRWLETTAKETIGLAVTELPESPPGTAALRVGSRFYSYRAVRSIAVPGVEMEQRGSSYIYTEASFRVTPKEMAEIERFIKARRFGKIVFQRDMRPNLKKGTPIAPEFDPYKIGLQYESCAAACASFFNSMWLEHFENNEVLTNLAKRLNLKPTYVAKRFIWENARNPHLLSINLIGINMSENQLEENFIGKNEWGKLRGLPVYGFIPDPVDGDTNTIRS